MQAFDMRSDRIWVHSLFVYPDIAARADGDQQGNRRLLLRCHCLWAKYVNASLLDKRGGNDEEDQHDENDVQHRRQIDIGFFFAS
jgi:hypothetical protein